MKYKDFYAYLLIEESEQELVQINNKIESLKTKFDKEHKMAMLWSNPEYKSLIQRRDDMISELDDAGEEEIEPYKIKGEYWIQDGSIQFADGDVGDYNHESIVMRQAQGEILNYLDVDSERLESGNDFEELVEEGLRDNNIEIPEDYDLEETFVAFIKNQFSDAESSKVRELYRAAADRTDLRMFAKKTWGWIWVNGNSIGLYELTPKTKKDLIDGLDNILSDEGADDIVDEQVNLFVGIDKTGKHYDVTLAQLREGSFGTGGTKADNVTKSDVINKLDKSIQHPFYKDRIDEVHFSDIYPKGFIEFYNKWKKRKKESNLFVRFDNGENIDSLAKAPANSPDHHDMIGVYAYPLKYVIDHPGDIWYGHNSRFVKVIKDKSKRKIILSSMEEWHAKSLLRQAGLSSDDLEVAKKYYPERGKGVTSTGKLFMSAVQMDFSEADSPRTIKKRYGGETIKKPKVRSGKEQTDLLLKMKVDAVEDRATTISRAAINDREPEQICWIKTNAFEILETFRMSDPQSGRSNVTLDIDKVKRKIAAKLSELIDDKLIETDKYNMFWTRDGRLIEIQNYDSSIEYRMKNLKMGQKAHKMFGKEDKTGFKIDIKSERGNFHLSILSSDKIEPELERFTRKWDTKKDVDVDMKYSQQQHKEDRKKESDEWAKKEAIKRNRQIVNGWEGFKINYNKLADKFGKTKIPDQMEDATIIDTYKAMTAKSEKFLPYLPHTNVEVFNEYMEMLGLLEKNGIRLSRIPEHNLHDLMNLKK